MSLPRYPKYRDSGIQWLDEVPEHWEVSRMRRVISQPLSNGIFKKGEEFGQGVPLVNVFDVYRDDFKVNVDTLDRINCNKEEIASYFVMPGDLFFVRSSLKQEGIAAVALAGDLPEPVVYECHLIRARPNASKLNGRYGSYLLNSAVYRAMTLCAAKITTMTTLDQEAILSLVLPLPPFGEQQKIAEFLDLEMGKIEALVEKQQRLIELLNERAGSLVLSSMGSASTSEIRLGCASRVVSRPVVQAAGETYEPLGLFNRGRGLFHKDAREMDEMGDSEFFWIKEGDLIISGQFAWEGAVALAGEEETGCVVSHRYPVLRGKPGIALTEYIYALLLTEHGGFLLNENSRGAAGRNRPLNIGSLLKEKIPIPDMRIQEKVAQAVHDRRGLLREVAAMKDRLLERRVALISATVTGKIDVRSLAPEEAA